MDIVFLDANVLFSAAYKENAAFLQLWSLKKTYLVTSQHAIKEAERNLKESAKQTRLEKLVKQMKITPESTNYHLIANIKLADKDRPILLAAIEAKAHYLITSDVRDFGTYFNKKLKGILILPPAEYLRLRY